MVYRAGHRVRLLRGATELVPAMVEAMATARHSISLETYIFDFEGLPLQVAQALEAAAQRGVQVRVVVDGVGTPHIPMEWQRRWRHAGVRWRVFLPLGKLGLLLPSHWRRLHRKLCSIDGDTGFCGGINLIDDHIDRRLGPLNEPRLDFSVMVQGPVVRDMTRTMWLLWWRDVAAQDAREGQLREAWRALRNIVPKHNWWEWLSRPRLQHELPPVRADGVQVRWVVRDNLRHRRDIERAYIDAIAAAEREVVCAMAYFLPGRSLQRAMIEAVQRGVNVYVLVEGLYENFWQFHASKPLHADLLRHGVRIVEYQPSALHAKVMVVDGEWATVGSSNMDPLSLLMAREANLLVQDSRFGGDMARALHMALQRQGRALSLKDFAHRRRSDRIRDRIAFWGMRLAILVTGHRY